MNDTFQWQDFLPKCHSTNKGEIFPHLNINIKNLNPTNQVDHFNITVPDDLNIGKSKIVSVPLNGVHYFNDRMYHNFFLMHLNFQTGSVAYLRWSDILQSFQDIRDSDIEVDDEHECADFNDCEACQNTLKMRSFVDEFELDDRDTLVEFVLILGTLYETIIYGSYHPLDDLMSDDWFESN